MQKRPRAANSERQPSPCLRGATAELAAVCTAALWLTSLSLTPSRPSFAAPTDVSISPSVASLFIGQEKIVEGTVAATQREGNVVRLLLGTPPQSVTVSLVIGMLSKFPADAERYYLGKTVRVGGTIESFRRGVEMTLHDPARIEVVEAPAAPAPAPDAPAVRGNPRFDAREELPERVPAKNGSVQRRLDTLSERIRVLEEKVQQLESPNRGAGEP